MLAWFSRSRRRELSRSRQPIVGPWPRTGRPASGDVRRVPLAHTPGKAKHRLGLELRGQPRLGNEPRDLRHYLDLMGLAEFANSYPNTCRRRRQRLAGAGLCGSRNPAEGTQSRSARLNAQTLSNMQKTVCSGAGPPKARPSHAITHSVERAIYRSSRILGRDGAVPARHKKLIDIKFAYPRDGHPGTSPNLRTQLNHPVTRLSNTGRSGAEPVDHPFRVDGPPARE